MILKHLFLIHSVVALFNGGSLVLFPKLYPSLYGITLSSPDALYVSQLLGAALLSYCLVAWFARNAAASEARRAIVLGFFITLGLGFILALIAQLSGVMNALGWMLVALYLLLALGYGYFYFLKPDTA